MLSLRRAVICIEICEIQKISNLYNRYKIYHRYINNACSGGYRHLYTDSSTVLKATTMTLYMLLTFFEIEWIPFPPPPSPLPPSHHCLHLRVPPPLSPPTRVLHSFTSISRRRRRNRFRVCRV